MTYHAEIVTEPVDGVEITWEVPYSWSRPRPATYLDPPEGGVELDGDPRPVCVTYYPEEGDELTIDHIEEGSILDILLVAKYGTPDDGVCWDAANEDNEARMEDPRW
jgi:hypothetical protein